MAAVGTNSAELHAIKKNRSKLVTAIAKQGGLSWFSQKLQEFDFITSELASGNTGKMGVSDEDKVSSLLEAVESKIKSNQRGTPFSDFVEILESEGCLQDMGQALRHMIKERASRSEDDIISGQIAMRMNEAKPSLSTQDSSADSTGGVTTLLQQLQAQIEQLKVTVRPDENVRSCPICNTELPAHLHQQDIESHVKAHFQDLAEISEQRPKLAEENTHKVQQRQLQHNSRSGTVEEALVQGSCEPSGVQEERVKELEEQVEQMGQNYEAASRELSHPAEESKQQQAQVEELLARQAQMQREFTELRDRYDEQNKALALQQVVLDEKVSELVACQQQKLALEEQLPRLAEDNTKLEHKVEQMGQNYEAASRELSRRAEESKQQQVQVEELLARQAQMQREFTELRDRYDEQNKALELQEMVLDEKVSELMACQQQKLALEEQLPRLTEDNTKLEHKVEQLRAQIEQLKAAARSDKNVRSCPICNTTFPARMHQQDFERHVQFHFQDRAEVSEQLPKLAKENTKLKPKVQQRQLQHKSRSGTVEEALVQGSCESSGVQDERVRELEEQREPMGQNCESVARELSSRAEESKQQQTQVEELLARQAQMQREFTELRDRCDEKVHVKNEALALQQVVLDEKVSELMACQQQKLALEEQLPRFAEDNTKLEHKVEQLRAQIEQLKAAARSDKNVRSCPICNTTFPSRMHQQDFERHVQGHFQERN